MDYKIKELTEELEDTKKDLKNFLELLYIIENKNFLKIKYIKRYKDLFYKNTENYLFYKNTEK